MGSHDETILSSSTEMYFLVNELENVTPFKIFNHHDFHEIENVIQKYFYEIEAKMIHHFP